MSFFSTRFEARSFFETKIPSSLHFEVTTHFFKVYSLLAAMLLICVYGAYQHVAVGFFFSFLVTFVCLVTILLLPPKDHVSQFVRLACFALMSYVIGSSLTHGTTIRLISSTHNPLPLPLTTIILKQRFSNS